MDGLRLHENEDCQMSGEERKKVGLGCGAFQRTSVAVEGSAMIYHT